MQNSHFILSNLALTCYALTAILYLISFKNRSSEKLTSNLAIGMFILATLLVAGSLAIESIDFHLPTLSGMILAGSIGLLTIIVHFGFSMRTIGAFMSPLNTLILLLQFFTLQPLANLTPGSGGPSLFVYFHIVTSILGETFAIGACGVALIFLWQQRALKKKLLSQLSSRIPALDLLEKAMIYSLWSGFIFITIGLISGAIYSQAYGGGGTLSPKVIWAIIVWVWYLAILIQRMIFNYPTKRIAKMSLAGFFLLATTFFGMVLFQTPGGF